MADKQIEEIEINPAIERARGFWAKFSKPIIVAGSAIILIIGGYFIYKYMFQLPKEEKANDVVFATQKYFADYSKAPNDTAKAQMAQVVLNGDGTNPGALKIIERYSGTSAENLCEYYAGAVYLGLKQFDKSIKYLDNFHTSATQIQSRAYGMMGDAASELKKNDDALSYYKKAAEVNEKDEFTSSEFLFRAASFAETIGKTKDAIDLYKKIRDTYPNSSKGSEMDKYLARLGVVNE